MLGLIRTAAPSVDELLARACEVSPTAAFPPVRSLFEETRQVLRTPGVDLLFRLLGNYPLFLENAWFYIRGNLQTFYVEAQADHIRARALLRFTPPGYSEPSMLRAAGIPQEELQAIRAWLRTQQYVLPKLMLFAAAWDAALSGISLGGARQSLGERTALPAGIPPEMVAVPLMEPGTAPDRVRDTFRRIRETHGYPVIHDLFRGLANWPDYFDRAWADLRAVALLDEYTTRGDELWWMARAAGEAMPSELPVGREWLATLGVTDAEMMEIRALLDLFARRVLPDVLIDVTMARVVLEGHAAAAESPFSATFGSVTP